MSEPVIENNLFFVCSFIEYISRKTLNKKSFVVEKMGKETIEKIYKLAEVYHCENIDKISDEIIDKCQIPTNDYTLKITNNKPTFWEIGRVYSRLILMVSNNENEYIENLIKVLTSWIIEKIDNYESSLYYESPEYIYACYKNGKILE